MKKIIPALVFSALLPFTAHAASPVIEQLCINHGLKIISNSTGSSAVLDDFSIEKTASNVKGLFDSSFAFDVYDGKIQTDAGKFVNNYDFKCYIYTHRKSVAGPIFSIAASGMTRK